MAGVLRASITPIKIPIIICGIMSDVIVKRIVKTIPETRQSPKVFRIYFSFFCPQYWDINIPAPLVVPIIKGYVVNYKTILVMLVRGYHLAGIILYLLQIFRNFPVTNMFHIPIPFKFTKQNILFNKFITQQIFKVSILF